MAIIKKITLQNGIETNYHRIVSVNNIINQASIIEIASYTDKSKREEEKLSIKNKDRINVFINTEYLKKEYTKNLNVDTAYEYLKTLEKFQECTDDI